jgi:hypothetical protein
MKIVIPSKGRAGMMKTTEIFTDAYIFCPEAELKQYKQFYNNIIGVPKEFNGITKTRNFILNYYKNENIVFIDDDLEYCGWIKKDQEKYKVQRIKDYKIWEREFKMYFNLTSQMNYKIWGMNTVGNNLTSYPYKPIQTNGVALGSCMGIINDGSYYFNEEFEVKEDYELSLRHIKERGGLMSIRYAFMQHEHTKMAGGCREPNRIKKEQKSIVKLIKQYPGWIKQAKHRGTSFAIQLNY